MADISELDKKLTMTWGLFKGILTSVVITTFTITTVYWRFQASERELDYVKEQIHYEREREDRRVNPLKESVSDIERKFLTDEIAKLKLENSRMREQVSKIHGP